jgi:thiosulfate dehydrogenase [quinone] large subunit
VSDTKETVNGRVTFLILRGFFAQFWLLQFFGKLRNADTGSISFGNLGEWSARTTAWFVKTTPMPAFAVAPYTYAIPYIELVLGLLIAVGFKTRWALLASAAYLVTLDLGLMLQLKHDVVGTNTITMLTVFLAVYLEKYNVLSVDQRLGTASLAPAVPAAPSA